MDNQTKEKIKKFLSEIQVLKRLDHVGVRLAGVKNPDSLAEHSLVSAQIAYVLARLEGADAEKCVLMSLFHDNEEVRLGDHHKVSKRYLNIKEAEKRAEQEHFANLPDLLGKELLELQEEKRKKETKEAIVSKDADWLEMATQAKIYLEMGYSACEYWIDDVERALKTESAKEILAEIRKDPDFLNCWWKAIEGMIRKN